MVKAPLPFPPSLAELGGLSNAELVQLVKQIESDHPQIKSLAHFMSKENKLDYIANLQYGIQTEIGHVIPAAESKYADFLAKAKAKNAATKVPGGANCAATMQKGLEDVALQVALNELPKLSIIQGDITTFFIDHPSFLDEAEDAMAGAFEGFISQLKALDQLSMSEHEVELTNTLIESMKAAKTSVTTFTEYNASGLLKQADTLEQLAQIHGIDPAGAAFDIAHAKFVGQATKVSGDYIIKTDFITASLDAPSLQTVKGWKAVLDEAAKLDPVQVTPKALEGIGATVTNAAQQIQSAAGEFDSAAILQSISEFKASPISKYIDSASLNDLKLLVEKKLNKDAWKQFASEFEQIKNVDLKTMAYQQLDAHGLQKSLGSFLTKEEKVELLSKFKAEQPVDDLVAKAKEKYLAKEAAAKGKVADEVVSSTIKSAEQKAAELGVDQASPAFDVLKAIDGEEHLAPMDFPVSTETEPHAPAKVTHVFTPTGTRPGAGSHQMEIFVDEVGDKWLFKVQPKWQSQVEEFAADVGSRLGIDTAEVRIAEGVDTSFYGRVDGSFQKMLANKGELGKEGGALTQLTAEQVRELQRQQVYDWLIANHDSHGENFLVGLDGHLIPIDKGQSMKFFGNDALTTTYSPNASQPVYNNLWAKVTRGELTVDFDAIDEMLTRVEQISSDEFATLLREQFAEKYAVGGHKLSAYLPAEMRDLTTFVKAAVERKEEIRETFTAFYKDIAQRSGVKWEPKWAQAVEQAAKIEDPVLKLAVQGDVATPIDSALANAIADTHSAGKALHLAGEEINQGQALVWQETAADGSKVLRMEVRLESQADARVTQVFEDAAGTSMQAQQPNAVIASGDTDFDAIHGAAKTVNHHAADGSYNQAKIDKMLQVNNSLFKAIDAADAADVKLTAGEIEVEEWAALKAEGEKATQYKQVINDIQDGISFQHKVEHVQKFDLEKAKVDWLSKAPNKLVPTPTKVEAPKLFQGKPLLVQERRYETQAGQGYMERVRTANYDSPHVSTSYVPSGEVQISTGRQFEGIIRVEDTDVKVTWSSWNMTSAVPSKSRLTFEVANWPGDEASVKKLLDAMQRLGVDSHLATREEERLTYWKLTTGQMKHSIEYANPSQASGRYTGLRATIDRIEQRIAAGALDTQGQIAVYREEMAAQFGQDAVDRAPEVISHVHDLLGREVGFGHFERFDLPEDLRPYFEKNGKQWGISRRANTGRDVFTNTPIAAGNGEKYRIGQSMQGASVGSDLGSGGSTGSFGSMGVTQWQSGGPVMVINPSSVVRRASTYSHAGDGFGSMWARGERNFLNPEQWTRYIGTGVNDSTKEIVARGGYSFFDDMEFTMVHSQGEKDALVATFRELGLDELRGLPIEERVVIGSNRDLTNIMNRFYKDHPDAYTHSLTSPAELQKGAKQTVSEILNLPKPSAPVLSAAAEPGSYAAEVQGYTHAMQSFDQVPNSTKAKLTQLADSLQGVGVKKSIGQLTDEFNVWWQETGQYKGLSQVKAVKSYTLQAAKQAELKGSISGLTSAEAKIAKLQEFGGTAKNKLVAEILGETHQSLYAEYQAAGAQTQFKEWLITKAKTLDAASNQIVDFGPLGTAPKKEVELILMDTSTTISGKVDALANLLHVDYEDTYTFVSSKTQEFVAQGLVNPSEPGGVTKTLDLISKAQGLPSVAEPSAVVEEGVPQIFEGKFPAPGSGQIATINTPIGEISSEVLNDITDAAYAIEHQDYNALQALDQATNATTHIGQSYGELLPKLDQYAKAKGLGGFPGESAADVLKSFVSDSSDALGKAYAELGVKPVETLSQQIAQAPSLLKAPTDDLLYAKSFTTADDVGKAVTAPYSEEKIFSYNINSEKVPVVFQKIEGGTNILVQEKSNGQWYLLKQTSTGKTGKDEIIELLKTVGHSATEPF